MTRRDEGGTESRNGGRRRRGVLMAVASLALAAPFAGAGPGGDVLEPDAALAELSFCLAEAGPPPPDHLPGAGCVGHVVEICQAAPGRESTLGRAGCAGAELSAWNALMNEWYQSARADMDGGQRGALRDAQLAWMAFRDATCAIWTEIYRGGSIVQELRPDCLRRETARRALELRALADIIGR